MPGGNWRITTAKQRNTDARISSQKVIFGGFALIYFTLRIGSILVCVSLYRM